MRHSRAQSVARTIRRARYLAETQAFQWLEPERARARAESKLVGILRHARHANRFYRERWASLGVTPDDLVDAAALTKLPLLDKRDVRRLGVEGLSSDGVDAHGGRRRTTGGSTGDPVPVFIQDDDFDYLYPLNYRVFSLFGTGPFDRICYVKSDAEVIAAPRGLFPAVHVPVMTDIAALFEALRAARPRVLACYPSIALELVHRVGPRRLQQLGLRAVSTNSEQSTAAERAVIADAFGCLVADDYGAEEVWMIASQCGEGRYHLHADNVWLEVLDDRDRPCPTGERGRVVVTSLFNRAMPFIRYELRDETAFLDERCPCGRTLPVLGEIVGRRDEAFVDVSGSRVSPMLVHNAVTDVDGSHRLGRFRLTQTAIDAVRFEFEADADAVQGVVREICARLTRLLGADCRIDVCGAASLPRLGGAAKHKCLVRAFPLPSDDIHPRDRFRSVPDAAE